VVKHLLAELPGGSVTYRRPVSCVRWSNTGGGDQPVTVETEDGERVSADHVIVTVPLGALWFCTRATLTRDLWFVGLIITSFLLTVARVNSLYPSSAVVCFYQGT
jgi:protoporphyrinogen oxidase